MTLFAVIRVFSTVPRGGGELEPARGRRVRSPSSTSEPPWGVLVLTLVDAGVVDEVVGVAERPGVRAEGLSGKLGARWSHADTSATLATAINIPKGSLLAPRRRLQPG